jgi:hypothetical protein
MDISECIEIFVFIHRNIRLLILLLQIGIHQYNLSLQLLILFLKRLLFSQLFLDSNDEFLFHFILRGQISGLVHGLVLTTVIVVFVLLTWLIGFLLAHVAFAQALTFRGCLTLIFGFTSGLRRLNWFLISSLRFFRARLFRRTGRGWDLRAYIFTCLFSSNSLLSLLLFLFLSD